MNGINRPEGLSQNAVLQSLEQESATQFPASILNLQRVLVHVLADAEPTFITDPSGTVLFANDSATKKLDITERCASHEFVEQAAAFSPDTRKNHIRFDADSAWYDVTVFDLCWDACDEARLYHCHDITLDKALEELMDQEAFSLSLPHVVSISAFTSTMMSLWKQCQTVKKPLSIAIFGIDGIDRYDDLCTRDGMETILSSLSSVLDRCIGRRDDVIGRFGGKRFIAVLPFTNAEGAMFLAKKICLAMEEQSLRLPMESGEETTVTLSISVGLSSLQPAATQRPEQLIRAADRALKNASERGSGSVLFESI